MSEELKLDANLPDLPSGYQYVKPIGAGMQGSVWLVLNKNMGSPGRYEAAKILTSIGSTEYMRFRREISTMANLNHPNIAVMYYANPAKLYFIMEYLDKGSLADAMARKSISLAKGLEIIAQIAEGLDFAHASGLLHRDVKPQNILFSSRGVPKICDFGLAKEKVGDSKSMMLTQKNNAPGTPFYMAPEQWKDSQNIDHRIDIWALGVILYQMLSGRMPFHCDTAASLMHAVLMKPVVSATVYNPSLSELGKASDRICLKMLEKEPERRYAKAGEVARDIRGILAKLQVESTPQKQEAPAFASTGARLPAYPGKPPAKKTGTIPVQAAPASAPSAPGVKKPAASSNKPEFEDTFSHALSKKVRAALIWVGCYTPAMLFFVVLYLCHWLWKNYDIVVIPVENTQMTPTFEPKKLHVGKRIMDWGKVERDDIVYYDFRHPMASGKRREELFFARVIGLPGDKIAFQNGKIERNGSKLEETYLKGLGTENMPLNAEIIVPRDHVYLLIDNRRASIRAKLYNRDSRLWGALFAPALVGKLDK